MILPISKKNKEQFEYIINIIKGKGEPIYLPDGNFVFDSEIRLTMPEETLDIFEERYNEGKIPCHYKYKDYIDNLELQETIKGLNLNPDAFWLLIFFIFDYVCSICLSGFIIGENSKSIIEKLLSFESENEIASIKIQATNRKKIEITELHTISTMLKWIKEGFERDNNKMNGYSKQEFETALKDNEESISVLIWYFAKLLKYFFEINPQFKGKAKKEEGISLNKNLLISQLIYYTRLSTNKNFLYDTDSLKGFFKQYKGKVITGHSNVYPTC